MDVYCENDFFVDCMTHAILKNKLAEQQTKQRLFTLKRIVRLLSSLQVVNVTFLFSCRATDYKTIKWRERRKRSTLTPSMRNQTSQAVKLQCRDAGRDLCWCASTSRLTFILEEQRGAVFNHFIVLALEQLALAVVEEQWCDHEVQFHPGLISRMLLQHNSKSNQGEETARWGFIKERWRWNVLIKGLHWSKWKEPEPSGSEKFVPGPNELQVIIRNLRSGLCNLVNTLFLKTTTMGPGYSLLELQSQSKTWTFQNQTQTHFWLTWTPPPKKNRPSWTSSFWGVCSEDL